jgi:PAS domain S-box-containing protein
MHFPPQGQKLSHPLYHSNMTSDRSPLKDDQTLRLRQILDSSPALIHTGTPDGSLDFFNRTWCEFVGKPVDELQGWRWTSCVHPDDIGLLLEKWRESIATGNPLEIESRVRRADGEFRWMLHQKIAQRDADGTIVQWHGSSVDIEGRKRLEASLRKNSEELQANKFVLAEAQRIGQMGSWSFDPATGFDHWSPELFRIHGLEPALEAPTSEMYLALVHPEDREFMASLMKQMREKVSGFDVTKRMVRPDGAIRYVRCVGSPGCESSLKRIGVGVDVTEHELLMQELNRRQAYLTEAMRLSHTGYFSRPASGEILWSNETYRIYELAPGTEVRIEAIIARVHPEDRGLVLEMADRVAGGVPINYRYRLLFPDGRIKFLHVLARRLDITCAGQEVIGAVIDRTEAEDAEEKIRQSARDLRTIIEIIPAFVGSSLPDGTIDFFSQSWLDYIGLTKQEAFGWGWTETIHSDDVDRVVSAWRDALRTGQYLEMELRCRRADGTYRWFISRSLPLRGDSGEIIKWYGILLDIEDRKQAEDHLKDARLKLAKASRAATVAELSASIAHQLNQPLMAISGNAQAAKRWLAASPSNELEAFTSIERVLRDVREADQTMQRIRALFKHEPYEKSEESVLDILRDAVRFVHEDPNKREIRIIWSVEASLPPISVDRVQTQQVFINLISNAIEATGENSHAAEILLRAFLAPQHEIIVQVVDHGTGLEDTEKIFEAFMTTKEKGMGIGLTVSKSIVEAHGGRLWAENNPDCGATFNVALPMSSRRDNR